ncbi:MAG: MFS transporter, partial [Pseudomonadota bacterium]
MAFDIPSMVASILWSISHLKASLLFSSLSSKSDPILADCLAVIPLVYLAFNVVYGLGALPAGILSDRLGPKPILFLAFTLFGFIYLGFARASQPIHIWMLFIAYGIFMAMTEGVQKAFLATLIPPGFKATGFGLYNTLVGLAVLPASLVGGFLWDRLGPQATFLYGSATAWVAAFLFLFYLLGRKV